MEKFLVKQALAVLVAKLPAFVAKEFKSPELDKIVIDIVPLLNRLLSRL
jgi:hypothetical protein